MQERDSGCWRKYAPLDYAMSRFNSGHRIEDHYVDVTEMIEIGNYYPDFLVKLSAKRIFIVETKGREDLDVPLKMQRLRQWCEDINRVQVEVVYDFVYVDQESFERYKPASFRQLVDGFREYKEKNDRM